MKQIMVKGPIIPNNDKWLYDMLGMEATSPQDILLPADNESVEVVINSGGGDVYAGSEIYTALKSHKGEVVVKIVGVAASAASVIAMAGDVVEISPTAQLMIHNVKSGLQGDHRDFEHEASVLEGYNTSIASAYVNKTGRKLEELLELMANETWFTADAAVENGLADKVMFVDDQEAIPLVASAVIPSEVITNLSQLRFSQEKVNIDLDKLAEELLPKMEKLNKQLDKDKETSLSRFCF